MAENKMKEVAKLLGVEMGVPFKIKNYKGKILDYNPYTMKDNGLYDKDDDFCYSTLAYLLNGNYEIERPILTQKEKAYLEGVLRPFKDRVIYINKIEEFGHECINLRITLPIPECGNTVTHLPYFEKDTMYKGMKLNKQYTIEELGLFE